MITRHLSSLHPDRPGSSRPRARAPTAAGAAAHRAARCRTRRRRSRRLRKSGSGAKRSEAERSGVERSGAEWSTVAAARDSLRCVRATRGRFSSKGFKLFRTLLSEAQSGLERVGSRRGAPSNPNHAPCAERAMWYGFASRRACSISSAAGGANGARVSSAAASSFVVQSCSAPEGRHNVLYW